jgi:predicted PurR-regulated permease PerM
VVHPVPADGRPPQVYGKPLKSLGLTFKPSDCNAFASCAFINLGSAETWRTPLATYIMRTGRGPGGSELGHIASALIVAAIIVAVLYVGSPILQPLVIAGLLAFILSPVIRRLRGWGLWRTSAVLLTVLSALAFLLLVSTTIVVQITQLADELPKYQTNLSEKVRALGGSSFTSSALNRASASLKDLEKQISRPQEAAGSKPLPVEVHQPEPRGIEAIFALVKPLMAPLATTGLVVLFLFFILLQREDLRDKFIRLAGSSDIQRATIGLNDAAHRLSRFFLAQALLNVGFGIVIGLGLWAIGIPNPALWGIFATMMRFVPYIGGFIAAFFPVLLATAIDPGWTIVGLTVALFLITEPIAGHVVEPILYGQHTGLSPVAVVIATLFWTMLWGPMGLLLATPLTVCLVVLGKHIESLRFIEILLGDEPALEPEERFYQRVLAGDANEAADQAEQRLKKVALSDYYDDVPMKALVLAQADAAHGKLSRDKQVEIRDTIEEIVEDLDEFADETPKPKRAAAGKGAEEDEDRASEEDDQANVPLVPILSRGQLPDAWQLPYPVLCVPSRSPLDESAALMLAQLLEKHGVGAWVQPFADIATPKNLRIASTDSPLVFLSYFGTASKPAPVRYLVRRLRRMMPHAKFMVGFWMLGDDRKKVEEWTSAVGADFGVTSLKEATAAIVAEASGGEPSEAAALVERAA